MISRVLRQLAFDIHIRMLRAIGIPLDQVAAFDAAGELVWMESRDPQKHRAMSDAHAALLRGRGSGAADRCFLQAELANGSHTYGCCVVDDADGHLLDIVFTTKAPARLDDHQAGQIEHAMTAVGSSIRNEYQLNKELESMASELAERYEELNLVFQADTSFHSIHNGFESLRLLVRDTVEFLDVGIAALVLPSKDLEIYDQREEISASGIPHLLFKIRRHLFGRMEAAPASVVVNNEQDRLRAGLPVDVPYKLVVAPVDSGSSTVVGMLIIANPSDREDFSNSHRNLIDVMARKITKVLQANFDTLTGMENGFSFEWVVDQALLQARSRGLQHALLHIDIDRTNVVNDISGRAAGDEVVRRVAKAIAASVRSHDSVARIGGDKFGVLLETCPLDVAAKLAQKISQQVEAMDFTWKDVKHSLSVSIGVAPITSESESVATVLSSAEVARVAAKERGRNRIQVYEQNDIELMRRRGEFRWVERIQAALREDRFVLFAQTIDPLTAAEASPHLEVLVRMLGDEGEIILPEQFIAAAEHYHLMPLLDQWVIRKAVEDLRDTSRQVGFAPMSLAVNLSGQSLSDERLRALVIDELYALGELASCLCFEITESAAIGNLTEAQDFIAEARRFGCRFSLDDFGSGLSSFAYLQKFDIDYLKIDGAFVRRIANDPIAASMVSAINQIGQVMGLKTIAEFAENSAIVDELIRIGVDHAQGYHFGRPRPLGELLQEQIRTVRAASG